MYFLLSVKAKNWGKMDSGPLKHTHEFQNESLPQRVLKAKLC